MKVGTVESQMIAARRAPCLEGQTLLAVDCGGQRIVAADQAGAQPGDTVLVAAGEAAARYCMDAPVDAAVVAVLRCEGEKGRQERS